MTRVTRQGQLEALDDDFRATPTLTLLNPDAGYSRACILISYSLLAPHHVHASRP